MKPAFSLPLALVLLAITWVLPAAAQSAESPQAYDDRQPAWSPDGSKIAFESRRNGSFQLFVIDAAGTGLHMLSQPAE